MLQASSEPPAGVRDLWFPWNSPHAVSDTSAREQEIARRREELLGMLHDLPESEYELSLTDLVEKAGSGAGGAALTDGKEPKLTTRSASGRQSEQQQQQAGRERRGSGRRWDPGSSFRSSSDGVLLNFYMPRSLTRSFTAPRHCRPAGGGGRCTSISSDCSKRERDTESVKCWPSLWDLRWRKSRRRDSKAPPNETAIRTASVAILKAANHSATSS